MAFSDRQAKGHSDYHMTMHYTHSDLNRGRRTLDLMADRFVGHTLENGAESKIGHESDIKRTLTKGEQCP